MAEMAPSAQLLIATIIFFAAYPTALLVTPGGKAQMIETWSYLTKPDKKQSSQPRAEPALAAG
jgi:uncharacterized protein (DUF608 family)